MATPTIYQVKAEQVGTTDISLFLTSAISKQFNGEFAIVNESTMDRLIPGFKGKRKIRSYAVEAGGTTHSLHFDITDASVAQAVNWTGH
jgi:hypothetical protein